MVRTCYVERAVNAAWLRVDWESEVCPAKRIELDAWQPNTF
ncbi:hypothetical protein J2739_005522 [Variovorax soli]|uniref:Uncharacterized protein n=1 Tax=Variovorax soli TaxID=376815 RepID=A0ABU1NMN2_9BURK|nr:hypothetical protein [Variovorax soli]